MTRTFPTGLRAILADVGQAAVEVECGVEGFREFVTLFRCEPSRMINVERRFPYLHGKEILFRLMRFRVDAEFIREDRHVSMEDLLDLQSLYVPTEEAAVSILELWQVPLESLLTPGATVIPVSLRAGAAGTDSWHDPAARGAEVSSSQAVASAERAAIGRAKPRALG